MIRFIKPYRVPFTLGSLAKLAEAMLELYLPILTARIIDVGIPSGDRNYIVSTGISMLLFALAGLCCAITCQYFAAVTSQGSGTLIRDALMDQISALSYRELDSLGTSTLINRLTSDVNNVQQVVAMTMRLVTRAPFICIGAVVMSFSIDQGLALIFVALVPVLGLTVYLLMRATAPLYRKVQRQLDSFALVVRENLSGLRVIRALDRTESEFQRGSDSATKLGDANIQVSLLSSLMNPATSIILNVGIIILLYLGADRVFHGRLSQGDLLALTTYATKILYALVVMANLVTLFTKASVSSGRISQVLHTAPTIVDCADTAPSPLPGSSALAFDDVSFAYSRGDNALSHIAFSLERGCTLGIVGATGSGKTTVINLLQRFYDPDSGQILLDGVAASHYPQATLRQIIGVVPQKNVLFSGTVADNLRWGQEDATEQDMIAALKTAQCWDFVSALPDGIHSMIQEGGKNFSGGQKQRLTIARAIVKRPRILILDDSLSALDYRTDLNLRKALAADLAGTTLVIVSQRISSIASADQILVLDSGGQAGIGSHGKLLATCETYREIFASQSQNDSPNGGAAHV